MIHIYYGYGKGKTSSAIGAGMRAFGAGMETILVQFLKDNNSSELKSIPFDVFEAPNDLPFNPSNEIYQPWVDKAVEYVNSSNAQFVILDEFLDVIPKFISHEKAVSILKNDREYIITGHIKNDYLIEIADYVTHFEKEKHPFDKGVKARKGIEF